MFVNLTPSALPITPTSTVILPSSPFVRITVTEAKGCDSIASTVLAAKEKTPGDFTWANEAALVAIKSNNHAIIDSTLMGVQFAISFQRQDESIKRLMKYSNKGVQQCTVSTLV